MKPMGPVHDPKTQELSENLKQKILNFFQIPDQIEQNYTVKLDLKKLKTSI